MTDAANAGEQEERKGMTAVETVTYTAPAISCTHCQRTIEGAVRALPGVQSVHVEIPTKMVTVRFDSTQATPSQSEATLDEEGYPVAT